MRVFGLIGNPLNHSFSKDYFTNKFLKESIEDAIFELFPLKGIHEFVDLIGANPLLSGLAVTIPFKESVMPYLDEVDATAAKVGAVNCITFSSGKTTGYNTDILGFEKSLTAFSIPKKTKALVLGTGGASKAVQYVFNNRAMGYLIVSRDKVGDRFIDYTQITQELLSEYKLIVNCTPIGMGAFKNEKPILPYEFINSTHILLDLIYNPAETLFLTEGIKKGAQISNGLSMLEHQADANWLIWNKH